MYENEILEMKANA